MDKKEIKLNVGKAIKNMDYEIEYEFDENESKFTNLNYNSNETLDLRELRETVELLIKNDYFTDDKILDYLSGLEDYNEDYLSSLKDDVTNDLKSQLSNYFSEEKISDLIDGDNVSISLFDYKQCLSDIKEKLEEEVQKLNSTLTLKLVSENEKLAEMIKSNEPIQSFNVNEDSVVNNDNFSDIYFETILNTIKDIDEDLYYQIESDYADELEREYQCTEISDLEFYELNQFVLNHYEDVLRRIESSKLKSDIVKGIITDDFSYSHVLVNNTYYFGDF